MTATWHSEHLFSLSTEAREETATGAEAGDPMFGFFQDATSSSLILGLHSWQCFAITLDGGERQSVKKRSMLAFELEDILPCDGEDLAIHRHGSREHELVLASEATHLIPVIEAVEESGIYVRAISPLVFLALDELASRHQSLEGIDLLLWAGDLGIDAVWFRDGDVYRWEWLPLDDQVSLEGAIDRTEEESPRITAIGIAPGKLEFAENAEIQHFEFDCVELASTQAQRIVDGRANPNVDLREGPLEVQNRYVPIARSLGFAAAAFLLLQAALIGLMLVRTSQYKEIADQNAIATEEAFRDVFPGERIPVGTLSRLESEHRRLRGTRGLSDQTPKIPSILSTLHAFLQAAPNPEEARYRFDRIEFTPNELTTANGVAKSFEDQELILARLRTAGLDVPELSATTVRGGVSLKIQQAALNVENGIQ